MALAAFELRFPISEVNFWAAKYADDDADAFDAGARIRAGDFSVANLEQVVRWKSNRRIKLISENHPDEVADALRLAMAAQQPRSAFAVLMGLRGVGMPMASAILTAIDQNKYTVVDFRAQDALSIPDANVDLNFYLTHYLPECVRLASKAVVSLRNFDRALWSWSKLKGASQ